MRQALQTKQQEFKKDRRQAWAEIHLDRLERNAKSVRGMLSGDSTLMAVVKANGYGHGAAQVSRRLLQCGVERLAVANAEEGIELRKAGIAAPILILGISTIEQAASIAQYDLTSTVCGFAFVQALGAAARKLRRVVNIHVRVDIGLGSVGLAPANAFSFISRIGAIAGVRMEGVYTHLASTYGGERARVEADIAVFSRLLIQLKNKGIAFPIVHAASSPAIVKYPEAHYSMVRAGILLYGMQPLPEESVPWLEPVMELKARIVYIKEVPVGEPIGYGDRYKTDQRVRIATIPIGYGDAPYLFFIRNGEVLIRGQRAKIIGRPFMDHLMVDASAIPEAECGDEAVLFGKQGGATLDIAEAAGQSGIDRDFCDCVSLLGSRVPRVYLNGNQTTQQ